MSMPELLTPSENPIKLKMLGQVSCGFPSPAADYEQPDLSLDQLVGITPTSSLFLFRACGDSMINAGIHDGDILVVDKGKTGKPGQIVLAIVGTEFLVKRLRRTNAGEYFLCAENPSYPPLKLNDGEILESWGVCRWVLHNLD